MESDKLLILDLDDTIFETKSIGKEHVSPILHDFKVNISSLFNPEKVELIMSDLWKYPFDHVSEKYSLNDSVRRKFSQSINRQEYHFQIETFVDFEIIRSLQIPKVLVTTGFKKLQLAKILALDLDNEFDEIHIDEIDSKDRIHKKGIFEKLVLSNNLPPKNFFVVGDNPDSEIKAGYELGLTTVQMAKFNQPKSLMADYYIQDFASLTTILEG